MQKYFIFFIIFITACSPIDRAEIEIKADNLAYYAGTNNLVSAVVTSKFEKSNKISSKVTFKNGQEIGKWWSYGYSGEIVSEGVSIAFPEQIKKKYPNLLLNDVTFSFAKEGAFSYCIVNLLDKAIINNVSELNPFANDVYVLFHDEYPFSEVDIRRSNFEYNFKKLPIDNKSIHCDTVYRNYNDTIINIR